MKHSDWSNIVESNTNKLCAVSQYSKFMNSKHDAVISYQHAHTFSYVPSLVPWP